MQGQLEHAERGTTPQLAVRADGAESADFLASDSDYERPNPLAAVERPSGCLGTEALVVVIVSGQHDVGTVSWSACQRGCMKELLPWPPELNNG